MYNVFPALENAFYNGTDTVLMTVIRKADSAPRGIGACMLADKTGRLAGSIGGGTVEYLALRTAAGMFEEGNGASFDRDYMLRKNIVEDIGMVCGGDMTVRFNYISAGSGEWREVIDACSSEVRRRNPGWLVITDVGYPMWLPNRNGLSPVPMDEEYAFFLPLPVQERALLFGGGHISRALTPVLASVGFDVTVMDCREEYARQEDFYDAQLVFQGDYERISDYMTVTSQDYAVVLTNGHSHDAEVEYQLLQFAPAYLGVIGSAKKTAAVNEKLRARGVTEEQLATVHTPVGLPIRAVTPEEIAISIAAEMILVRAQRREAAGAGLPKNCPMH